MLMLMLKQSGAGSRMQIFESEPLEHKKAREVKTKRAF